MSKTIYVAICWITLGVDEFFLRYYGIDLYILYASFLTTTLEQSRNSPIFNIIGISKILFTSNYGLDSILLIGSPLFDILLWTNSSTFSVLVFREKDLDDLTARIWDLSKFCMIFIGISDTETYAFNGHIYSLFCLSTHLDYCLPNPHETYLYIVWPPVKTFPYLYSLLVFSPPFHLFFL